MTGARSQARGGERRIKAEVRRQHLPHRIASTEPEPSLCSGRASLHRSSGEAVSQQFLQSSSLSRRVADQSTLTNHQSSPVYLLNVLAQVVIRRSPHRHTPDAVGAGRTSSLLSRLSMISQIIPVRRGSLVNTQTRYPTVAAVTVRSHASVISVH